MTTIVRIATLVTVLAVAPVAHAQVAMSAWDGPVAAPSPTYTVAPNVDPSYFTSNGVSPYFNANVPPVYTAADPFLASAGYETLFDCLRCPKAFYDAYSALRSPRFMTAPAYIVDGVDDCGGCLAGLGFEPAEPYTFLPPTGTPLVPFPSMELEEGYPYPVEDDFIPRDEYEYQDEDEYEYEYQDE
jgi:hypothetical protein